MTEQMRKRLNDPSMTFLVDGAEWYRNNVWHDPKEMAVDDKDFLAEWEYGGNRAFTVWRFPYHVFTKPKKDWKIFVSEYNVKRWCYIEDLLPDAK